MQTTALVVGGAEPLQPVVRIADERLREKEFGVLDRLTKAGIEARFAEEAARRQDTGKFYYRPPGGESWCDVILRLRSVLDTIQLQYRRERVLIVTHQVVVLCFRYLLESMNEEQILQIDAVSEVANCSITAYELAVDAENRNQMKLRCYNFVAPLTDASEPVTTEPDVPAAPR
jgi:probable phosphoglycerate mutase